MEATQSIDSASTHEAAASSYPRRRIKLSTVLLHATIIFFCLIIVLPIAWVILMSIKSIPDAYTGDLWPKTFDFSHYGYVFAKMPNVLQNFANSIIVTFSTVVITCIIAILAGYALVHVRLPGRWLVLSLLVGTLFFPSIRVSVSSCLM
jgi:ABC-type glycerol-3-phosphate transport system permease component